MRFTRLTIIVTLFFAATTAVAQNSSYQRVSIDALWAGASTGYGANIRGDTVSVVGRRFEVEAMLFWNGDFGGDMARLDTGKWYSPILVDVSEISKDDLAYLKDRCPCHALWDVRILSPKATGIVALEGWRTTALREPSH